MDSVVLTQKQAQEWVTESNECLRMLKKLEWDEDSFYKRCPICKRCKSEGHSSDCGLREMIDKMENR
jgi:hypothetical protein